MNRKQIEEEFEKDYGIDMPGALLNFSEHIAALSRPATHSIKVYNA